VIRSIKNTFAIANKVPPEVLSLIPDHWEDGDKDNALIVSTHVCRRWREIFILRPSLWTRMDCRNVEKTKVYIERSKNSSLEIYLDGREIATFCKDAFLLTVPHIGGLKTLSASSLQPSLLPVLAEHFSRPVPLLKTLKINLTHDPQLTLPGTLFNGDLSSLRELHLTATRFPLSWRGLENLTIFNLSNAVGSPKLDHLLDFFWSTPRLYDIELKNIVTFTNAPPGRIVSLPNLRELRIIYCPWNSILLDHLSIPYGAIVTLIFTFSGSESPIPPRISDALDNFHNLSHITAVNLCFGPERRAMRLNGPSGELYVRGEWKREGAGQHVGTDQLVQFAGRFDTSRCRRLWITQYNSDLDRSAPIVTCAVYQLLLPMGDLRNLTLIDSNNLPFILALNPDKNSDKIVLCPELKEITLHFKGPWYQFHIHELLSMAKERASRGAKLSGITIFCADKLAPLAGMVELRKLVSLVECEFNSVPPPLAGFGHQQINQVLWRWARILDRRSRFVARCGPVLLGGPSGCWGAGVGVYITTQTNIGSCRRRKTDLEIATRLRPNPPAPPGTSYSRPTIIIPNTGAPVPPCRVVPS